MATQEATQKFALGCPRQSWACSMTVRPQLDSQDLCDRVLASEGSDRHGHFGIRAPYRYARSERNQGRSPLLYASAAAAVRGIGIRVVEPLPPLVDTPATRTVSISPASLVYKVMRDISRGKDEIMPGKVPSLPMLMRLAPSRTARLVAE